MKYHFSIISLFCALLFLFATTAHAYIGPIILIGAVGSLFGWVAAIGLAIAILLSYPFYLMYRRKNGRKLNKTESTEHIS